MNDQRSTTEQLKDIYVLAVKAGHYDGANCILNIIGEGFKMEKYGFKEVGVYDNDGTGSSPVHNIVIQKIAKIIDEMIEDNKKYYDENGVCWLCYEDEFCYHQYKIEVLVELKKKFSNFSV